MCVRVCVCVCVCVLVPTSHQLPTRSGNYCAKHRSYSSTMMQLNYIYQFTIHTAEFINDLICKDSAHPNDLSTLVQVLDIITNGGSKDKLQGFMVET